MLARTLKYYTFVNIQEDIAQAAAAANRIQAMRVPDRTGDGGVPSNLGAISHDDRGVTIELRDVWFKYPTRDVPVLNGLNMTASTKTIITAFEVILTITD